MAHPALSPEANAAKKASFMVVATLLATTSFQLSVSPPGGLWGEDHKSKNVTAGYPIMLKNCPTSYCFYVWFNDLVFFVSLTMVSMLLIDHDIHGDLLWPMLPIGLSLCIVLMAFIQIIIMSCLNAPPGDKTIWNHSEAIGAIFLILEVIYIGYCLKKRYRKERVDAAAAGDLPAH